MIESVLTEGYIKHYVLELNSDNKDDIVKQAQDLQNSGHYVNIHKMSNDVDIVDLQENFRVVDKVEKDITHRGIVGSMSMVDKLNKYMEIKEVPEKLRPEYLKCALDIIDSVSHQEG
jgi:alkyl sulfatase BDS1-like metallo-beta-lactamase superfamily hydrolase